MPYLLVLERASGTHKHSVQQALGLLTSTCSVVCLFPQVHSNKLRLAALEVPGFIFLWCLGAQRKGMVISMNRTYHRGDMYYADLGQGIGSEQEGYRPVLIIQNDTGNKHSPTVIVAAISSKVDAKAKLPTHYLLKAENGLELPSLVLMEQLRTIDKRRLETYIGHLEEQHIRRLNRALAVSVGLIEETPKNLIMCLCPACANNFYGTGSYYLRRVHPGRVEKEICTYCGQRPGFDYEVIKRKQEAEK